MNKHYFLTVIIIFFGLLSCSSDDTATYTPTNTSTNNTTDDEPIDVEEAIKYLALGDSYTIGQGVEVTERWPNQLTDELQTNNYPVEKSEIIAQTGWTTSNLINGIENSNPQDFNLVSLLIGVNNQFTNLDFEIFTNEFNLLIQEAFSIAGNGERVFVVSIPDYSVTPFGNSWGNPEQTALDLDMYNNFMNLRCQELGIPFINITKISRALGDSDGALAPDNLHPSGFQYSLWVDEILPIVLSMVSD